MSNIFKSTSRFSSLMETENTKQPEKNKSLEKNKQPEKKNHNYSEKRDNTTNNENIFKSKQTRNEKYIQQAKEEKELLKQEEERKKVESLKIENFPELVTTIPKKETDQVLQQNYIDKLKTIHNNVKDQVIDPDLVNLKHGWVLIKKDKITGQNIIKRNFEDTSPPKLNEDESFIGKQIINACVDLYEKRTLEYIELNGYDIWEKQFKCRDWMEWSALFEDDLDDDDNSSDEETNDEDYCDYYDDDYESFY